MTPAELAADLRTRINPKYATQIGTESYERRICAEAIESLLISIEFYTAAYKTANKIAKDALAENAKLRFALSNVLDVVAGKGGTTYPAWDIARAALGEKS